ncbi:hypothetical protein MNBD_NITROSPIRAE01-1512 [hydrothermal vent metagenome]|uniref:GtrA/DPMS transmembrane domain-containing protein n=1 Tax=hydrothermal vent metagenome TaxID=652676 RepID=A0A3B1DMG8_9ZZZZ
MIKVDKENVDLTKGHFHVELARYILSGGISTAFHWSIMALLVIVGSTPVLATAIGAMMGAILNYFLQRKITFQSVVTHRFALPRYLSVCVLTWFMNLFFFVSLHRRLQFGSVEAQMLTTFLVAFMTYFLYKKKVFNDD